LPLAAVNGQLLTPQRRIITCAVSAVASGLRLACGQPVVRSYLLDAFARWLGLDKVVIDWTVS
jgi:hypothetical protein